MEIRIGVLLAIFFVLMSWLFAGRANAEPKFQWAGENGVVVTLYDDPCALKDKVNNLPQRATWAENGKTYEGCAGLHPLLGVVMLYFEDKTIVLAVPKMFKALTST